MNARAKTFEPKAKSKATKRWWASIKDVDPITLNPLSELAHPPFELIPNASKKILFDPVALKEYFLASGNFSHPITREPISRADCARLDAHLRYNGLGDGVAKAFDSVAHVSASQPGLPVTMRREGGLVAGRLFEYPPLLRSQAARGAEQRTVVHQGAVNIIDDDVWEQLPVEAHGPEAFPTLPSRPVPASRSLPGPLPPPPRVAPLTRERLVLAPRSATAAATTTRSEVFGNARPREEVLKDKGVSHASASSTAADNDDDDDDLPLDFLCPFPPSMLQGVRDHGLSWVSLIERKLDEFLQSSKRGTSFDPMPPVRRRLIAELCTRHWNIAVQEMDPEPHRFLELALTTYSAKPQVTLAHAYVCFAPMLATLLDAPVRPGAGLLFLGVESSQGGPPGNSDVHAVLANVARESEYEIAMLDWDSYGDGGAVLVEFSTMDRARRCFKALKEGPRAAAMTWRRMQWWVAGAPYAQAQIATKLARADDASEQRRRERALKQTRARNQAAADAWDAEPPPLPLPQQHAAKPRATSRKNMFDALDSSSSSSSDDDDDA